MRLDQATRIMNDNRNLGDQIGLKMGYRHLDWIAKDTDMMVRHFIQHAFVWDIPEIDPAKPLRYDDIVADLYDLIIAMPYYTEYNDGLPEEDGKPMQGIFILRDYQIQINPETESGFSVIFRVSFVDPNLPLM